MNGALEKMVLAIFFSFAVLYMLFLFPYIELCRTGKYDGSITVSGNYTDWEITEARTSIYTCRVDGERRYTVSEMWLNGKRFGMDCPALTPGKEVTAEDYDGNFWYVFLPQEQARIPAQRFKTALFALPAYPCVLSGVYWFYWRPRLIAEKEASAAAKEKFQEKVREMEELKSAIFSDKKEVEENSQKGEEERILFMEDYTGNSATALESKALEFQREKEELRKKEENERKIAEKVDGAMRYYMRRDKLRKALEAEENRTGIKVPFLIWLRYGIASITPSDDGELPDTSESPNELPEVTYYRKFAEDLLTKLRAEDGDL